MLRVDDSDLVVKCWLSPNELDHLERTDGAAGWKREIAMQLMARCGLRVSEVSYPSTEALRWSKNGGVWIEFVEEAIKQFVPEQIPPTFEGVV